MKKTWWLLLPLLGCGASARIEEPTRPVERRANRAFGAPTPTQTTLTPLGTVQSWWPLELAGPVEVEAGPEERSVALPIARSVQGVLTAVTSPTPVTLLVDGAPIEVSSRTVVFLPAKNGAVLVKLAQQTPVRLSLLPVMRLDTMGGGFVADPEPDERVDFAGGSVRLATPQTATADDTMLRLATVSVASSSPVRIGRCEGPEVSSDAVAFEAGRNTTAWLPGGALCLDAAAPATVTISTLGRVRRFATTTLRPVTPAPVIDTRAGITWVGAPGVGQVLEAPLPKLTGATHLLLSLSAGGTATARVTSCAGATPPPLESTPGLWLVSGDRVCVHSSGKEHLSLSVIGAVTARDEAPPLCSTERARFECEAARTDVLGQLRCVPGVAAAEVHLGMNRRPGVEQFDVWFEQPSDHTRPERGTFRQHLIVSVRSLETPMVLHTPGYAIADYSSDVSRVFPTNEIEVEHRFFGTSVPEPLDLDTLTIMQSAADSHRIVEAFSPLFTGPWVNTGHSKGGMTALFHRRFFPCDVDGSAPYVTPISLGRSDERYGPHLTRIGGAQWASCREAYFSVDRAVIQDVAQRASTLPGTYSRIGSAENALWATTGAGYWGIFQYGLMEDPQYGCGVVTSSVNADLSRWVGRQVRTAQRYADEYDPPVMGDDLMYPFQTLNELGAPGTTRAHLASFGPVPTLRPEAEFNIPLATQPTFEPRAMPDVLAWLSRYGARFQFLYGEWDPWTGGAVDTPGMSDAAKFIVPEGAHGVSVRDLPLADRLEAIGRLQRWLGVAPIVPAGNFAPERVRTYADVMQEHPL